MRRFILVALPLTAVVALAGCGGHATEETTRTVTKDGVTTTTITTHAVGRGGTASASSTGGGLSIDSDRFKANVDIPGLTFGGDDMDLDGMKLYPGSTVKGMHVHATDRPGAKQGVVVIDFSSPAAPTVVAQHMADQARSGGFALATNTAALVSGSKPDDDGVKRFSVTLNPNGDGTIGQLTITGKATTDD